MIRRTAATQSSPSLVRRHQQTLFSCGLQLADLVVASDLLHHSWTSISSLNEDLRNHQSTTTPSPFRNYPHHPNFNIIAFASKPISTHGDGGEFLVPSSTLEENSSLFQFLCSRDNPLISINKEALTLFVTHFDQLSDLHNQLNNSKPVIVTGHSMGGSVASLFTLWLLENLPPSSNKLPFCITFGCPLIGDEGLQQAISDRQTWNHRFLHVCSHEDRMPRVFIGPDISRLTVKPSGQASRYKPFGTFLMCSQSGGSCFEDPESILELMEAVQLQIDGVRDYSEGVDAVGYVDYGEVLEHLKTKLVYKDALGSRGFSSSPRAEMAIQLEAIGLETAQQHHNDYDALITSMENRELENYFIHRRRISDPTTKLNEIKVNMAYLEWYKKVSKTLGLGYYDSYKRSQHERDMDVISYKIILTNYWKDMVAEAERKPQKLGVSFRTRWLYGGTNYRRMVEPLDIAEYYKTPGKDYQTQGRSPHYILLERWQQEDNKQAKKLNAAASLTEDSCFWAQVEDAVTLTKLLKNREEASHGADESSRTSLMEFESYVMGLIHNFSVSPEIFLEKSTFMQWWRDYESTLDHGYSSPLTEFMRGDCYRQYA